MTSEILIMNRESIALAADSAATLTDSKIFQANKIFTLSKFAPVGIMVYGQSAFMGIPWETLIKNYRNEIGNKKFDTIKEYTDDFIRFLTHETQFIPESNYEFFFVSYLQLYFNFLNDDLKNSIQDLIKKNGSISDSQVKDIIIQIISKNEKIWETSQVHPTIKMLDVVKLFAKYQKIIDTNMDQIFEKNSSIIKSDIKLFSRFMAILGNFFTRFSEDLFPKFFSGIVIAGFGEKEIFPSYYCLAIWGKIYNFVKCHIMSNFSVSLDESNSAILIPFAQDDMVKSFIEGIEPKTNQYLGSLITNFFGKYPEFVVTNIDALDPKEKIKIISELQTKNQQLLTDFFKQFNDYRKANNVNPVINIVKTLPRDELAGMAESLVNLTSFKRRVSMQAETVSGPIDVAVITKGDGFIWIKRKHYFQSELNPHFFANYYHQKRK